MEPFLVYRIPIILFSLTLHEYAHGYFAYRKGDSTAKNSGRLTLNPLAHLDPVGALMLLFGPFGWAKPVPVNPANFRDPKKDNVIVSIAGPLSNMSLALICGITLRLLMLSPWVIVNAPQIFSILQMTIIMNLGLACFNIIPIYPLDGSHVLIGFLDYRQQQTYWKYMKHGFVYLLIAILVENYLHIPTISLIFIPFIKIFYSLFTFGLSVF
ncbi:MAG: site-2 protease family protein [bacterium]